MSLSAERVKNCKSISHPIVNLPPSKAGNRTLDSCESEKSWKSGKIRSSHRETLEGIQIMGEHFCFLDTGDFSPCLGTMAFFMEDHGQLRYGKSFVNSVLPALYWSAFYLVSLFPRITSNSVTRRTRVKK
ncbi:hypothetical protein AVEN_261159-1 [Araneus ventricosus]|uniref:Uncharacterized protein n=1 Tax=Araneus ventricosus TaxID=182803 RepID=A0A4Y2FLZ6_ARAVE|nr:hypothetical protein AVEN_261159-1 [Araneus ventricosus]